MMAANSLIAGHGQGEMIAEVAQFTTDDGL
jgi:hypothetical protein